MSRQSEHLRTIFDINYQYLNEIAWQIGKSEPLKMCIRDSAKGVGRSRGARVQIPLSPLFFCLKMRVKNKIEKSC